jgi:hypothetical protein
MASWIKRRKTKGGTSWALSTAGKFVLSRGSNKGRQRLTRSFDSKKGFHRTTTLKVEDWHLRRRRKGFFDPAGWILAIIFSFIDSLISRKR